VFDLKACLELFRKGEADHVPIHFKFPDCATEQEQQADIIKTTQTCLIIKHPPFTMCAARYALSDRLWIGRAPVNFETRLKLAIPPIPESGPMLSAAFTGELNSTQER